MGCKVAKSKADQEADPDNDKKVLFVGFDNVP